MLKPTPSDLPEEETDLDEPSRVSPAESEGSLFRIGHGFRVKNALIYVISNGLQRGATVIVAPILLAKLSVAEYGIYALLLTVYTLGPAILSLGLYGAIGRFYFDTKDPSQRHRVSSSLVIAHAVTVLLMTALIDLVMSLTVTSIAGIPYIYFRLILWAAGAAAGSGGGRDHVGLHDHRRHDGVPLLHVARP